MKLYKLTDENGCSFNHTQWGENVTHEGTGEGGLCGPGWIHAYTSPLLAVILNPIHANFINPQLWEAKGIIHKRDYGLKVGCKKLTTIKRIDLPQISITQRVAFGILCAQKATKNKEWQKWATGWLNGKDRSLRRAAARAAAYAAAGAADAAFAVALDLEAIAQEAMKY